MNPELNSSPTGGLAHHAKGLPIAIGALLTICGTAVLATTSWDPSTSLYARPVSVTPVTGAPSMATLRRVESHRASVPDDRLGSLTSDTAEPEYKAVPWKLGGTVAAVLGSAAPAHAAVDPGAFTSVVRTAQSVPLLSAALLALVAVAFVVYQRSQKPGLVYAAEGAPLASADVEAPSTESYGLFKYLTGQRGSSGYGSSTTARRVAIDFGSRAKGKVAIITGCSGGIGAEMVLQLCQQKATVVMACRDAAKMKTVADQVRRQIPPAKIYELSLDLGSQQSIKNFVDEFGALGLPCDLLINNAGIMACPKTLTEDGYESQFGINHLGHFTLTNLLAKYLKDSPDSRVVNLASTAHSMAYLPQGIRLDDLSGDQVYSEWGAYGQSKLANVLHAQELNRRFKAQGMTTTAYSVHPGVIATDLWRYMNPVVRPIMRIGIGLTGKSIPQGAATTMYCALAPDATPGYYSDCNEGELSHPSFMLDPQLATKLWEKSVEMTDSDLVLPTEE